MYIEIYMCDVCVWILYYSTIHIHMAICEYSTPLYNRVYDTTDYAYRHYVVIQDYVYTRLVTIKHTIEDYCASIYHVLRNRFDSRMKYYTKLQD